MESTKRTPTESTRLVPERTPEPVTRTADLDKRERDITARELALDSQLHGKDAAARQKMDWWKGLSAAEKAQVDHALAYADHHAAAGALGAEQYSLIAKLARLLDAHEVAPA